jgi:LuxR family transcriptional regulator, quorum-sensing system regulator LasR
MDYERQDFSDIDPTVRHAKVESKPILWDHSTFQSKSELLLYEQASGYNVRSGVVLPIHGAHQEAGMLCFTSVERSNPAKKQDMEARLPALSWLRDVAFDSASTFLRKHVESIIPKLTKREKECLQWMASGKSTWEISKILCCSEATISFHMVNIRTKFGVTSKTAAVFKAMRIGLLDSLC